MIVIKCQTHQQGKVTAFQNPARCAFWPPPHTRGRHGLAVSISRSQRERIPHLAFSFLCCGFDERLEQSWDSHLTAVCCSHTVHTAATWSYKNLELFSHCIVARYEKKQILSYNMADLSYSSRQTKRKVGKTRPSLKKMEPHSIIARF